jgi:uncharacterized protein (TIGR01244 family)
MAEFRTVTDHLSVAGQINLDDIARAAEAGFTKIINNRPDSEAPGQPTGREIEDAARAAGLGYASIPVIGGPSRLQAEAMKDEVDEAPGPVLAFCRSGNRSICAWALGEALAGRSPAELVELGEKAGYNLRPMLG